MVRPRPQHQVARPGPQAAVVDQQVAHLDLTRDPRVEHPEIRQVLDHRIGPLQLARIDKVREQAGGHRLAVGGDLEQGIGVDLLRSEEHTSELQSLMRTSYAVFGLKKKKEKPYSRQP